ncbi:MAG: chloride channel protein [Candidatus Devosia symbiotica]|nr:chloride channel protein [Candidatus Devosia symbiotica]
MLTSGAAFGVSVEQAKAILEGEEVISLFGLLKLIGTPGYGHQRHSGGSIFSPSMSVGAGLPTLLQGRLGIAIGALAIMCMAAYLAALLQTPITAFVIVTEMTGNHVLIFPVMIYAVIASFVFKAVCKKGIYHVLAH